MTALQVASRASVRTGDDAAAIRFFDKILVVDANNQEALKGATEIYFREKKYANALPLFIRLMDLQAGEWSYFFNAAVCQAQLRKAENSVMTLELAAANFGDARVYGWVGAPYFDPIRDNDLFNGFQQRIAQVSQSKVRKKITVDAPVLAPAPSALPSADALKSSN
jgi:tetratricopeptide (TPR) repeat protein